MIFLRGLYKKYTQTSFHPSTYRSMHPSIYLVIKFTMYLWVMAWFALGNVSNKIDFGFCNFVHTLWTVANYKWCAESKNSFVTFLTFFRLFTNNGFVTSYHLFTNNSFVTFYHLIRNNSFETFYQMQTLWLNIQSIET